MTPFFADVILPVLTFALLAMAAERARRTDPSSFSRHANALATPAVRAIGLVMFRVAFWIAPLAGAASLAVFALAPPKPEAPAEAYALPITPPVDQGDTGLCWVFATLSMLETNYMSRHPGERIELSRAALQRAAIADRFQRFLHGEPGRLEDGGVAVEAINLIRENGLVERADFHDIVASEPVFQEIEETIAEAQDKGHALDEALNETLGDDPKATHLGLTQVGPKALARTLVGGRRWIEYDLSRDGSEGWGASHDPDARADTRVRYVKGGRLIDLIHQSLKRGEAVVAGTVDHARLIYGAEYDREGRPIAYLIKDSLAPYKYRLDADEVHETLTDVTVSAETSAAI